MSDKQEISEKTRIRIPLSTVVWLLLGCISLTTTAVKVGQYLGGADANATGLANRVAVVEQRVDILEKVDIRLARIEGKLGIFTAPEDALRVPANTK